MVLLTIAQPDRNLLTTLLLNTTMSIQFVLSALLPGQHAKNKIDGSKSINIYAKPGGTCL